MLGNASENLIVAPSFINPIAKSMAIMSGEAGLIVSW